MKTSNTTEDNLHILIVDDEPIVRLDLKAMLKVQGYDVIGEAGDGLTAVDLCREYHPDVVLMDVKMPVFDGLTAADTILKEKLADCVILLTAFNDAAIIDQARTIGVTGYLVKPIDQKSLKPTIEVAHAQSLRLAESRDETTNAYKKLEEQKQIRHAQSILAKTEGMTETEAYHILQKLAMDHNRTMAQTAALIISKAARNDTVKQAKKKLMEEYGLSEEDAYRRIRKAASQHKMSLEEAAKAILKQQKI